MATDISETEFDDAIKKGIVLVDFWADWCAPCHALAPILEKFAEKHPDVAVLKLNVDENQSLAMKEQVVSIPTVKIYKEGKEIAVLIGVQQLPKYEAAIAEL